MAALVRASTKQPDADEVDGHLIYELTAALVRTGDLRTVPGRRDLADALVTLGELLSDPTLDDATWAAHLDRRDQSPSDRLRVLHLLRLAGQAGRLRRGRIATSAGLRRRAARARSR